MSSRAESRDPAAASSDVQRGSSNALGTTRIISVSITLAALVATCGVLHMIVPSPPIENITPKLRFFAEHKDEFDTLFIGTSRIQHQISPAIFDRVTAESGRATHSFNFGVDGMHPAESFFVTEQLLALQPRKLRAVFLELEDVQVEWSRQVRGTRRLAHWHNWRQTALTIHRAINPSGRTPWLAQAARLVMRSPDILLHLNLFLRESANVGRVSDLVANQNANKCLDWIAQLGPDRNGYQPPSLPMSADRVAPYQEKLQRETQGARRRLLDPYADGRFREYAAQFRALGARVFFIVTPVVTQSSLHFRPTPPPPGPVFHFNSAKAYPQLYDPSVRADEAHLSQTGADQFTRLVATRFLHNTAAH